jgi:hypothetical protein
MVDLDGIDQSVPRRAAGMSAVRQRDALRVLSDDRTSAVTALTGR